MGDATMQEGWVVVVTECGSGFDRSVELEDNLDWYAVAMAGEAAMAGSSNGSCSVTLIHDGTEIETLYPKGRDSERRAWGMASVITKLKKFRDDAGKEQHRFQVNRGINHCGICGKPRSQHVDG